MKSQERSARGFVPNWGLEIFAYFKIFKPISWGKRPAERRSRLIQRFPENRRSKRGSSHGSGVLWYIFRVRCWKWTVFISLLGNQALCFGGLSGWIWIFPLSTCPDGFGFFLYLYDTEGGSYSWKDSIFPKTLAFFPFRERSGYLLISSSRI